MGILVKVALNLGIALGIMAMLTVLILPIQQHRISGSATFILYLLLLLLSHVSHVRLLATP